MTSILYCPSTGLGTCSKQNYSYQGASAKQITLLDNGLAEIGLTQGKHTLVNQSDPSLIEHFNWYYADGYAAVAVEVNGKTEKIRMHQLLLDTGFMVGKGQGNVVDHMNRDKLDNRRDNLRITSQRDNGKNKSNNSSGLTGVYFDKSKDRWRAYTRLAGKRIHRGYFDDQLTAAAAYQQASTSIQFGFHPRSGKPL